MHGQFSWYDLMTPDVAASKKFYPSITAWGTEEWDKADYSMWTAGGTPFAGMNPITPEQRAQGIPSHWLGYVSVDSVDSAASKVTSLGGSVMHGPEDIPDVGRFAIIRDPQGAMLAIFKSSTPAPGWDGTPSLGKFTWHELMTTDANAALTFYRQLFGWQKMGEFDMGPSGRYATFGMAGKAFGGIYTKGAMHGDMPPNWLYYANVKDVKRAAAATTAAGGTIVAGPMEVPGGDQIVIGIDTLGAMFAVHQTKPAAAPKAKRATTPRSKPSRKARKKTQKRATKRTQARAKKRTQKRAQKRTAKRTGRRVQGRKAPKRTSKKRAKKKSTRRRARR